MNILKTKLLSLTLLIGAVFIFMGGVASAHVVVKPSEVETAGFQSFVIGVPNEKDISTTSVKLEIPEGLKYVTPTQKAGWKIDIEKSGVGEDSKVQSITWSGNEIKAGFRDDFSFSAQVPTTESEIKWKAYQTYADGVIVGWDQDPASNTVNGESVKPYSVTKVVSSLGNEVAADGNPLLAADRTGNLSLSISIAAVVVGLVAFAAATRKNN